VSRRVSLTDLGKKVATTPASRGSDDTAAGATETPAAVATTTAADPRTVVVAPSPPSPTHEAVPVPAAEESTVDDDGAGTRAANNNLHTRPTEKASAHPAGHTRYDEYERKEARLRDDQYGRLTSASRRLNRLRKGEGERITENTLIRVAIDLLLAREKEIAGKTEADLRRSLAL
jgi:hypothetical protein